MGGANAPRGEHESALAHSQPKPEHCAGDVHLVVWHTLYPDKIHSTTAAHYLPVRSTLQLGPLSLENYEKDCDIPQ